VDLYPKLASVIHSKGFGRSSQSCRYDVGSWDSVTQDALTLSYGHCLTLEVDAGLVPLDWDLGLVGGEALIVL